MYIHCYPKARVNKSAVLGIQDFSLYEMSKLRDRNCGSRIEVNLIVGWATVTTPELSPKDGGMMPRSHLFYEGNHFVCSTFIEKSLVTQLLKE